MLKLLSNGFFKNGKNNIGIDYKEDIEFNEFETNDSINLMVDDYNFDMNDLKVLQLADDTFEKNPFTQHCITKEEYDTLAINYYIYYDRQNDLLKIVISIYDFDYADDEIILFLNGFNRQVDIIINTQEEKDIIMKKINDYCVYCGYNSLEDFFKKEYDEVLGGGVMNNELL